MGDGQTILDEIKRRGDDYSQGSFRFDTISFVQKWMAGFNRGRR